MYVLEEKSPTGTLDPAFRYVANSLDFPPDFPLFCEGSSDRKNSETAVFALFTGPPKGLHTPISRSVCLHQAEPSGLANKSVIVPAPPLDRLVLYRPPVALSTRKDVVPLRSALTANPAMLKIRSAMALALTSSESVG